MTAGDFAEAVGIIALAVCAGTTIGLALGALIKRWRKDRD